MELAIQSVEFFRWIGIAVMTVVCLGGLISVLTQYENVHSSVSSSIGKNTKLYIIMGLLLSVGGALFYLFLALWLIPHYHVHSASYLLLLIAFLAQLGIAWAPVHKDRHKLERIHIICGGIVSVSMILFLTLVLFTAPNVGSIISALLTFYLFACYIYLFFFIFFKKYRFRYFLLFESLFIGGFGLLCILLGIMD